MDTADQVDKTRLHMDDAKALLEYYGSGDYGAAVIATARAATEAHGRMHCSRLRGTLAPDSALFVVSI